MVNQKYKPTSQMPNWPIRPYSIDHIKSANEAWCFLECKQSVI